jgi:hypothetical protein
MATLLITRVQSGWGQEQWLNSVQFKLFQTLNSVDNFSANRANDAIDKMTTSKLHSPFKTRKVNFFLSLSIITSSPESQKIIQFVR